MCLVLSKSSHSKSIHWIKLCKSGVWRCQKSRDQWSWRPREMWCHSIGCCEKATDALIYPSDVPFHPVGTFFFIWHLTKPSRYFTNVSDILRGKKCLFSDITQIFYTYFLNIVKIKKIKKKQDKMVYFTYYEHAKLIRCYRTFTGCNYQNILIVLIRLLITNHMKHQQNTRVVQKKLSKHVFSCQKKKKKKTLQTAELPERSTFYYNSDIQSNKIIQPDPSPTRNRLNKHTMCFVCVWKECRDINNPA